MAPTALHRNQIYTALRREPKTWQKLTHFPLKIIQKPNGLNIFSKGPINIHLDFTSVWENVGEGSFVWVGFFFGGGGAFFSSSTSYRFSETSVYSLRFVLHG